MSQRQVRLRAQRAQKRVITADLFGDDSLSGGVGGWESENVGKTKRPALRYTGNPGWQYQLPLIFDGAPTNASVESRCRQLQKWGRGGRRGAQPPRLLISGKLLRAPKGIAWVIDSLEWGPQMRRPDGRRIQQQVTVNLIQWSKPPPPPPKKKKKKPKKKPKGKK